MNDAFPVGSGEANEEYFKRSLPGKLRLRGTRENNHWKANLYRVEGIDPTCFACDIAKEGVGSSSEDICNAVDLLNLSSRKAGPCGATEVIECNSSYKVPTQMEDDSDEELDFAGGGAYHGYMPMYTTATKMADSLGPRGKEILKNNLSRAIVELTNEARTKNGCALPAESTAMGSLPTTSTRRTAIRKRKVCSPTK